MSEEDGEAIQVRANAKRAPPKKKHTSLRVGTAHLSENFRAEALSLKAQQEAFKAEKTRSKDNLLTFGVELSVLLQREQTALFRQQLSENPESQPDTKPHNIPSLVEATVTYLEKHALEKPGIFRLCGKHSELMSIQSAIDSGLKLNDEEFAKLDINTVGDILKAFLRQLPRPVIPTEDYFPHFLASINITEEELFLDYLGSLVKVLPKDNRELLQYLCKFFLTVTQHAEANKMTSSSLAIIFAPPIFGQTEVADSHEMVLEAKATSRITQAFIGNYEEIFLGDHEPMQFLVANETIVTDEWSILKGEEVLALVRDGDEDCLVQVNGLILVLTRAMVEARCKPKPPFTGLEYLQPVVAQQIAMIRQKTLRRLATVQPFDPPMMTSSPIQQSAHAGTEVKKKSKKGHFRRTSLGAMANSIVKKEFGHSDDHKDKDKHTDSKDKDKDKDKDLPKPEEKITVTTPRGTEISDHSPEKDEGKKSKKAKKEKQKQINTAVASWYNAPSTRSSNSFFGPGGFNINRLALAARQKERLEQREREKRDGTKDKGEKEKPEKDKSDPSKNILKNIVGASTELFPTPRKKSKPRRTPSLLAKSTTRKPASGVVSDETSYYNVEQQGPMSTSMESILPIPDAMNYPQLSPKRSNSSEEAEASSLDLPSSLPSNSPLTTSHFPAPHPDLLHRTQ